MPDAPADATAFDLENFTLRLLAEALLYDHEYGAAGAVSLVDVEARRERYLASFLPEAGAYVVEEATAWEADVPAEVAADVAYALATDSVEHDRFDMPEAVAIELLRLARTHDLLPSLAVLFEDDEA
jgi:hypothetical protein